MKHIWIRHPEEQIRFCRKCGVVERKDGQNGRCPGLVRIRVRKPVAAK